MEFDPRTFVWRLNLGGDLLPHSVASGATVFEFGLRICVRRDNLGGGSSPAFRGIGDVRWVSGGSWGGAAYRFPRNAWRHSLPLR